MCRLITLRAQTRDTLSYGTEKKKKEKKKRKKKKKERKIVQSIRSKWLTAHSCFDFVLTLF